uniref:C69 family dipeptidase n=1 Tax=uncultured Methanobrevibacter sp. TaxID=253161 RepID=UPI0025F32B79
YGDNNEINLLETYSGKETVRDSAHMRTWIGHQLLAPSKFSEDYDHNAVYPLCFTPDKAVSLQDVSQVIRNRYEGTKYSPDETGRIDMRVIGTDATLSAHVIQVFPDLPSEMSCLCWVSSGPVVYGVLVPLSNDCINVIYLKTFVLDVWNLRTAKFMVNLCRHTGMKQKVICSQE